MFLSQHALRSMSRFRIAAANGTRAWKKRRAAVELLGDKVHRDAMLGFVRFQRRADAYAGLGTWAAARDECSKFFRQIVARMVRSGCA